MHACTLCVLFNVFDSGLCYWFSISLPHVPSEVRYDFPKILFIAIVIMIQLGVCRVHSFFTHTRMALVLWVRVWMDDRPPQIENMCYVQLTVI